MTEAPAFTAWLDEFFASYYRRRPVNATFIGVHEYDHRLPDYSQAGIDEMQAEMATLRERLDRLPVEVLSESETLDRDLAAGFLDIQRWEYASQHFAHGNPSVYTSEAIFGLISLFLRPFAPWEQRAEAAIARLDAISTLLDQGKEQVRSAPAAWTARAIRECDGGLALLLNGIDRLMHEQGDHDPHLRGAANGAAAHMASFQRYLETYLRRHTIENVACGDEAFDLLLRRGHFLPDNAATIEAYAQDQFERAQAYLGEHARDFGATDWRDVLAQLADHLPSIDNYYARYGEVWEACRAAADEHGLLTWPHFPIRYVPQPHWAREAAPSLYFLFYRAPAAFDRLPITEYLVTPIEGDMPPETQQRLLRATNDSVIKLNHVVHHGAIGHHVQNWHAMHAASRIGQVAAVDCASRIAMFCGGTMAEGWACYATELMDEIGFLTPLEHFAEQHTRLRMAARALVDIRLHHGQYTLQQAAQFYEQQVGLAPDAAHGEAVKNSMFPGTALMYLIGTDQIHQLRRDLAAAQGASFNLQAFHDRLLEFGSVPVSLIAAAMRREAASSNRDDMAKEVVSR
jgi:hypothetical protein